MVEKLLSYSSNKDERINQILPLVKDKLDVNMVGNLLYHSSNPAELKKRIDAMKNSV